MEDIKKLKQVITKLKNKQYGHKKEIARLRDRYEGEKLLNNDLIKALKDHMRKKSSDAQLRKRSMDSNSRPRAKKNILSNNKDLQGI